MRLALAGDTMLGRGVATRLRHEPPSAFVDAGVLEALATADLFVLNLECAISDRGTRWPEPAKPFFFRGPPTAVDLLVHLGVDCVTLANNHALDFGREALADTVDLLSAAGIACVGAGASAAVARTPARLSCGPTSVAVVGLTDHPRAYAATVSTPGVAHADLRRSTPAWVGDAIAGAAADIVLVTPHWGPNMVSAPVPHVRRAARDLRAAGATLVAGHSAHVFHGVSPDAVLYDLGDFLDDYAVDRVLRNDLGLLFLVTIDGTRLTEVEAVPLKLDYCRTTLATGEDAAWIGDRFRRACAELGSSVATRAGRLCVTMGHEAG